MGRIADRLLELGITLPPSPPPAGAYLPYVRHNDLVQLAGVAPRRAGEKGYAYTGKIGRERTIEEGIDGARLCCLSLLANLSAACGGDLDRVRRVMMVRGYVNAVENFEEVPRIVNGASELFIKVFGEKVGAHARTSIGCGTLPSQVTVEVDALVVVDASGLAT